MLLKIILLNKVKINDFKRYKPNQINNYLQIFSKLIWFLKKLN